MATSSYSVFAFPSLFQASTKAVLHNLRSYEDSLWEAPENIKQALLRLMSKRGLITDDNIEKVLYSRLRTLELSSSKVSDQCLFKLTTVKYLVKIDLNTFKEPNETITSAGITRLSENCPYLQIVYLRRNILMTDEAVIALSKNCPMLRELNVGGCRHLTDASLVALGAESRHLKSLNIIMTQVTDGGIHALCQGGCAHVLTEIDISGCTELTDDAVEILIDSCPQLGILLFSQCRKMTDRARISIEEKARANSGSKMKQVSWTIY